MAALQQRNGSYRILFQFGGKQHSYPIGTVSLSEAKFANEILDTAGALGEARDVQTYRLLELLISRMQVDLETMEVEIDFAFPSWLGSALQHGPLGLDSLSAYRQRNEAHLENERIVGHFHCHKEAKPACYTCKRRLAA